jgi:hypothetical protein
VADWPGVKEADLHEARLKATTDLRAVLKGLLRTICAWTRPCWRRTFSRQRRGQADPGWWGSPRRNKRRRYRMSKAHPGKERNGRID